MQENDPDSVMNFYRKAIELRKNLSCVRYGKYKELNKFSGKIYEYTMTDDKEQIHVICSFSDKEEKIKIPEGEKILGNYDNDSEILKPYECRLFLLKY